MTRSHSRRWYLVDRSWCGLAGPCGPHSPFRQLPKVYRSRSEAIANGTEFLERRRLLSRGSEPLTSTRGLTNVAADGRGQVVGLRG